MAIVKTFELVMKIQEHVKRKLARISDRNLWPVNTL